MFNFSIYKETRKYFNFYDVFLKEQGIRKEDIFKELYINNSTYRRCRDEESKIGREIITNLSERLGLKVPTSYLVDDIEEFAEKVYNNMYYKVYNSYDEDMAYIDSLIEEKSLLFPILELMKLFMLANSKKTPKSVLEENMDLYKHIEKYRPFFTKELIEILDILTLSFEDYKNDNKLGVNYSNALSYHILAASASVKQNYIEALYFGEISKEMFMKDMNIKRVIAINFTIMTNLLNLGNYDKCYDIAFRQLHGLKALNIEDFEYGKTFNLMIVALFGRKEYQKVIKEIENIEVLGTVNLICLFTSLYMVDRNMYNKYMDENKDISSIILLDKYLKTKDKKLLPEFEKLKIASVITKILSEL